MIDLTKLKPVFRAELNRPFIAGTILTKMSLEFENCDKEDVFRYVETEFPQWDLIHLIQGYKKSENNR